MRSPGVVVEQRKRARGGADRLGEHVGEPADDGVGEVALVGLVDAEAVQVEHAEL
jgi:hypothetical protein